MIEEFNSISGEVGLIPQGAITHFIRLAKCDMTCKYCDVEEMNRVRYSAEPEEIADRAEEYNNILITGGEPLKQTEETAMLLSELYNQRNCNPRIVQIETNGTYLKDFVTILLNDFQFLQDYNYPRHSCSLCFVIDIKSDRIAQAEDLETSTALTNTFNWARDIVNALEELSWVSKGIHTVRNHWIKGLVTDRSHLRFMLDLMRMVGDRLPVNCAVSTITEAKSNEFDPKAPSPKELVQAMLQSDSKTLVYNRQIHKDVGLA